MYQNYAKLDSTTIVKKQSYQIIQGKIYKLSCKKIYINTGILLLLDDDILAGNNIINKQLCQKNLEIQGSSERLYL